jgi:hypothetical protein
MVQSMRANQLPEHPFHDSWTCQSFQAGDSIPGVEELPGLPTKKKKASFPIKKCIISSKHLQALLENVP